MSNETKIIERIAIDKIFENHQFLVPIYQRNYAWGKDEIEQLIDDILDAKKDYYLGNLILFDRKDSNKYEVIDGQQRLTTLYLIMLNLNKPLKDGAFTFEARDRYNNFLEYLRKKESNLCTNEEVEKVAELDKGYKTIDDYLKSKTKKEKELFKKNIEHTYLLKIFIPEGIDLNHYFETMNTRGEQLELHEIAKGKILSQLEKCTKEEKLLGAKIWDICSNMDYYVVLNFSKYNRSKLFGNDYKKICFDNFDTLFSKYDSKKENGYDTEQKNDKSLKNILEDKTILEKYKEQDSDSDEKSDSHFKSIIDFPTFLLCVNAALAKDRKDIDEENDVNKSLDDKTLLKVLKRHWKSENSAKNFLYNLLKYRCLFDNYIIKRENIGNNEGEWSLKYATNGKNNNSYEYINTLSDDKKNKLNHQSVVLQSCLRVTYTSPKTMHWIPKLLKSISSKFDNKEKITANCIIDTLEKYCKEKLRASDYKHIKYAFNFQRIVFTYLDYILFRDGYKKGNYIIEKLDSSFKFIYRNSIEHFYPQHPSEELTTLDERDIRLNSFGNLALITVSGNSKFSNLSPSQKIEKVGIVEQSPKLQIMAAIIKEDIHKGENANKTWLEDAIKEHEKEMFDILDKEIITNSES